MAPRDQQKATPKIQRTVVKTNTTRMSSASTITSTIKKVATKKPTEKTPATDKKPAVESRPRTNTVPKMASPKHIEKKPSVPSSVTKSGKKLWKRRPKPAHSGVPLPDKLKRLQKLLLEDDCSF